MNENLRLHIGAWESVVNLLMGAEWLLSEGKIKCSTRDHDFYQIFLWEQNSFVVIVSVTFVLL